MEEPILKGDVNGDGVIDMMDVFLAQKAATGQLGASVKIESDVNADQKIGVFESIFDLQGLGELRSLKDMMLDSSQMVKDQAIPEKYTADADNVSPPLTWSDPPTGTKSLC